MNEFLKAVKVSEKVYWVGAIDWNMRSFHGYTTERGSTYNAYLILDEKVTLIDTVKAPFLSHLIARIKSVIDLEDIDYIVSNHAEMDHSGCIPDMIELCKPEAVFASPMGVKALNDHFDLTMDLTPVKTGERISLGQDSLYFVETKLIHWPDSMFSFLENEQILFSQDGFGCHYATNNMFIDQCPSDETLWEQEKYFANILMLYGSRITEIVETMPKVGLPLEKIKMIAPDHGPVWRKNIEFIIGKYLEWSSMPIYNRAVVIYDTMWGATEKMAYSICEGLRDSGVEAVPLSLQHSDRSRVATEVLLSGAVLCGCSTMNNNMMPTMADILCYLKGLKPKNRIGAAFGSFGWSGESVKQMTTELEAAGIEIISEGLRNKYALKLEGGEECYKLGQAVAQELKERLANQ